MQPETTGWEILFIYWEVDILKYLSVRYSAPGWLVEMLLKQYNFGQVEKMLEASLKEKKLPFAVTD